MSEIRDLTDHERSVLEFLLQGEWDGAAALRSQLKTAIHVKSSSETAAFEIAVADDAPRAPQTVKVEQGELYVRVENGTLVGLGCAQTVTKLPPLAELFAA
jgi:hypothetical protein